MTIRTGNQAGATEDLVRIWSPALFNAFATAILNIFSRPLDWQDRQRQRYQLLQLSDRALHDIGLNRLDAEKEAFKPFWLR